jgi:hypothetical protein
MQAILQMGGIDAIKKLSESTENEARTQLSHLAGLSWAIAEAMEKERPGNNQAKCATGASAIPET